MAKNVVSNEGAFTASTKNIINDNFADFSRCTTQFDATSGTTGTTLTNVVGMVTDVLQPGVYEFEIDLGTVATTNCGLKLGLKFGTASMLTSIEYGAILGSATGIVTSRGTTSTDAASIVASTTAILKARVTGTCVVAVAGTLQLQAAQNASHSDTTSVFAGSYMKFIKRG
jgi:hypothetical protein